MSISIPFKIDLTDRIVAITGGAGVLMSHFAKVLAACGARVALLDVNYDGAKKVADEIGENAIAIETNALDKESLCRAKSEVEAKFGRVNYLINGAGGNNPRATTDNEVASEDLPEGIKDFFALDESGIRFVFDLNILSAFLTTQVFASGMKDGDIILNISSMNAFRPLTKIPAYSAAKAGISNLTQWLAVHFAPVGIRVNAIAPGFFITNQNRSLLFKDGEPTARSHKILTHTPMNRFGEEQDLTGTLLWLSDNSSSGFVTGVVVPVDGGFAAYSGV